MDRSASVNELFKILLIPPPYRRMFGYLREFFPYRKIRGRHSRPTAFGALVSATVDVPHADHTATKNASVKVESFAHP
jgi:hypothetical protein